MRSLLLGLVGALAFAAAAPAQTVHPTLAGDALVDALVADYKPAVVLSLEASKDTLYAVVDTAHVGGQVGAVGVYTGQFVALDCDPTCDPSQDINDGGAGLNQEHVWPRSRGAYCPPGSVATCDPRAESDLHHLRAALSSVNSARGNLPFGVSPDALTTAWYRLGQVQTTPPAAGRDEWSERQSDTLFEPRRSEKGDIARAALYAYTMYGPRATRQADEAFFATMREALLDWNDLDPPDARETARMWRAAAYQEGKPNPFVLDPTLARRAFGEGTTRARSASGYVPVTWINEVHYDDAGDDDGEFVEVAVDAAFPDLAELVLTLYNGGDGTPYGSYSLATFARGDTAGAARLVTLALPTNGLQNGAPDGLALSYVGGAGSALLEFVCYEGTMTATAGPAAGAACTALGVEESNATAEGTSLQRVGVGESRAAFTWTAGAAASPGAVNAGQVVVAPTHAVDLAGPEGWHVVAAPTAVTVADLLGPLWTQGAAGADVAGGSSTVFAYAPGTGWAPVADLGATLAPGDAVLAYVFEDDDPRAAGVQGGFPKTLAVAGYAAGAPFRFSLAPPASGAGGPDGFTLVGNPSRDALAWTPGWDRSDLSATIYVYDPALPGYRQHNGTSGSLADGLIPAFTGFWVEASGAAPSLLSPAAPASRRSAGSVETLGLEAHASVGGAVRTALATVAFDDRADPGPDDLDGRALDPFAPDHVQLASRVGAERLALDARPLALGDTVHLDLAVVAGGQAAAGEVTLRWTDLPSVPLRLLDHRTGTVTPLEPCGSTTLAVEPGGAPRLAVLVGRAAVADEAAPGAGLAVRLGPTPTPGPSRLWAEAPGALVSAEVVDALGRRVARVEPRPDALDLALPTLDLAAGLYVVRVTAERRGGPPVQATRLLTIVR